MSNDGDIFDFPDPVPSIIRLTQELVRTPSQASRDTPNRVLQIVDAWLSQNGVQTALLNDAGDQPVALVGEVQGDRPGPIFCLDACIDTAPVGDAASWSKHPMSGDISDGWLYGRGSADSKVAVSIFSHIAATFQKATTQFQGHLIVLFDADEHTGRFGGIKSFMAANPPIDGMMIGYPGNFGVITGARGFYRASVVTYGTADHSGSARRTPENAITKAGALIVKLSGVELPREAHPKFAFGPKLTVTEVSGGSGYSTIPDQCILRVDVRLTPGFSATDAQQVLQEAISAIDREYPSRRATSLRPEESWPAYELPEGSLVARALSESASKRLGREVPHVVCGPSNIGNYLAAHGIEATCGFGVTYKNLHAVDERIELASIGAVYDAYRDAIAHLLSLEAPQTSPAS